MNVGKLVAQLEWTLAVMESAKAIRELSPLELRTIEQGRELLANRHDVDQ